jgi:hypothetical protein
MFKFLPNTAVPGFRIGRPDDELGFNVANDGSTPPVLPGAPDVPTVDDNYPFGATSPGFIAPPALQRGAATFESRLSYAGRVRGDAERERRSPRFRNGPGRCG